MHSKFLRTLYRRSSRLKRWVIIRRPVLLRLKEFKIYVRLDDWSVGLRIALQRGYETHVTNVMRPLLKPGMVVVDIGANVGYYALLAASRIGKSGSVHAFEPNEADCALLTMSLAANGFQNVILHKVAVADFDGVVGYDTGGSNGAISRDDPNSRQFQVQAVKLDSLLPDEKRIDLLKMDIEGAEGLALAGMTQLIARHRPIIFTEFFPLALQRRSHLTAEEYLNCLRDFGYNLHVIHRVGGQNATPQNNEEIMLDFANYQSDHIDLVAYPN